MSDIDSSSNSIAQNKVHINVEPAKTTAVLAERRHFRYILGSSVFICFLVRKVLSILGLVITLTLLGHDSTENS